MIRERQDIRMVMLNRTFHAPSLMAEAARVDPSMIEVHEQVPHGGKLMSGATKYHSGGWKYVPFTEHGKPSYLDKFTYIRDMVMPWFRAPILRARIMVLEAGAEIHPHVGNLADNEKVRWLIPLLMPSEATYYVEGETFKPQVGQVWYLNQNREHWVENKGKESRLVLAVDTPVNDWVIRVFSRVGVDIAK